MRGQAGLFDPGGEGAGGIAAARTRPGEAPGRARPRLEHSRRARRRRKRSFLPLSLQPLRCRLCIVAALAQTLVIGRRHEQSPVSAVRDDVINDLRPDPAALACALPAEGLPQELSRPPLIRPDRQAVPGMPGGRFAALVSGLVSRAVSLTGQHSTAGMSAGSQGQPRHGLSPPRPETQKSPSQRRS